MDENYSVNLPAVTAPASAIEDLSSTFKGEVIRVDNAQDIDKLDMTKDKSYLIIVSLKPINCKTEKEEYRSFQKNGIIFVSIRFLWTLFSILSFIFKSTYICKLIRIYSLSCIILYESNYSNGLTSSHVDCKLTC